MRLKKCGDLFSKADKATVVLEYRKLAKEFHPDVCPLPNAEDVFKHLSKLYEEALDLLAQGQWEISNVVSIRDNCGKTYQGRYLKTSLGMALSLAGCGNRQMIDLTYSYKYAIISLPNGEIVEGKVDSWKDFEDGDQLQITVDDVTYLVHATDAVLMTEER